METENTKEDKFDELPTDAESISEKTDDIKLKEQEDEDEFMRLLDEFIKTNIDDDTEEEEEDDENQKEDDEEEGEHFFNEEPQIRITDILLAFSAEEEYSGCFTKRAQFRSPNPGEYLHAEIQIYNPHYEDFRWSRKLNITLDNNDELLDKITRTVQVNRHDILGKLYISFPVPSNMLDPENIRNSRFSITVCHNDLEVFCKGFQLMELPESYTECFQQYSFALFRNEEGEEVDYSQQMRSQSCFNQLHLGSVVMVQIIKNLLSEEQAPSFTPEFEVRLHDETGRIIVSEIMSSNLCTCDAQEYLSLCWEIGQGKRNFWKKGIYLVEILFMDETIISAPFEIGNKDIESIYGKESIQPKTNIAGKKILRSDIVDDPMQKLNNMIGLTSVKNKISDYRNLILMEQKRNAMGLPTQMHSLHAAFIGNPGTGKTTVAGLLGKILKDMGMLSKGHVVYEERSTLLGQYYSSEGEKTIAAMQRAKGGILFIDEAYTLYKPEDPKDPGMNILTTLLTALADESNRDWMLLLAGYPGPMKNLLNGNPGLESRIPETNRYYFDDYSIDELMQIGDLYCRQKCYELAKDARKALQSVVKRAYNMHDETFGNGRYIETLFSEEILHNMAQRISKIPSPTREQLITIEKEDIPSLKQGDYKKSLAKLQQMVGLQQLKKSISNHLNFVNLVRLRNEQGIHTSLPSMHMVFTGNPGTGKTTVADFIGEIYASLGLLSRGNVVRVERSDFMDTRVGGTELKTKEILKSAQGNVLFIDEAYSLLKESEFSNDSGPRVIETLLTTLGREETDMLVIMAGYPGEMEKLLESNPGLKSRFPYIFHFEDYTADELMEIAKGVVQKNGYCFSAAAMRALKALITKEVRHKDRHFGNGRFVTQLINTKIIPAMSSRLATLPESKLKNKNILQTIQAQDIPITEDELKNIQNKGFDEKSIARSLQKLDSMIGLQQIKKAIHDFVDISRYLNSQELAYAGNAGPLKWSFTGNTGTGKSTVAGIMAELLHAMNLLGKGQLIELKAEEIYNVQDYKVDEILKNAMKRSQQGLLFVDGDAPVFKSPQSHFDSERLRFRLTSLTADLPGNYALIIAEHESVRQPLVNSLKQCGIAEFDHTLHFEDYTASELLQILEQMLKKRRMKLERNAKVIMAKYISQLCENRELGYANARTMKLLSRSIAGIALLRESKLDNKTKKGIVTARDVEGFIWKNIKNKVGYK